MTDTIDIAGVSMTLESFDERVKRLRPYKISSMNLEECKFIMPVIGKEIKQGDYNTMRLERQRKEDDFYPPEYHSVYVRRSKYTVDATRIAVIVAASDCKTKITFEIHPMREVGARSLAPIHLVDIESCLQFQVTDRGSIPLLETDKFPLLLHAMSNVAKENNIQFHKSTCLETLRRAPFFLNVVLLEECLFTSVEDWPSLIAKATHKAEKKLSTKKLVSDLVSKTEQTTK